MKKTISTVFTALLPIIIFAQVMDESNIKKLEKGEFQLEKGKIQVTFVDTVSSGFIENTLAEMGYTILSSNFQNIILKIENDPSPEQLRQIEDNKWVDFVMSESEGGSDDELKELSKKDTLDNNKVNKMLSQLNYRGSYQFVLVGLKYSATKEAVEEIQTSFPDLDININVWAERSAIIKTEDGREADVIEEMEALDFVESTAYIGNLE